MHILMFFDACFKNHVCLENELYDNLVTARVSIYALTRILTDDDLKIAGTACFCHIVTDTKKSCTLYILKKFVLNSKNS